jgi:serine/threonine-protein kinase
MAAIRESKERMRAANAAAAEQQNRVVDTDRTTGEYVPIPSRVVTQAGDELGPWPFARLVEAIATGEIGRGDKVDYMGRGLEAIESIEDLARFLPARSVTTNRVANVGAPDFVDDVSLHALVTVLLRVVETEATGVLFAEGPTESRRASRVDATTPQGEGGRKELYFVGGKLHHVASNNASELLGEYLARRGVISREELDFALAVLPRYGGRMGDTLISLGLVASLDIFRAIRDQGRDRLIDLFQWPTGSLSFYGGQAAPHVEFPLELELLPLVLAGIEIAEPGDAPVQKWRSRYGDVIGPATTHRPKLRGAAWPPVAKRFLDAAVEPAPLRDVLATLGGAGGTTPADALRALEVLLAGKLLAWH